MKKMRVALALVVSAFTACFTQAEGAAAISLPKATVTQCAPLTLTAAEHDYMVWPSGDDTVDRPLQIVMNFKAQETLEEAKAGAYGKYKCDFYLTIEGLAGDSITADGCYLAGNYGSFGWIVIPTDGTVLEEGVSYPIISAYDANLTYEDICGSVKDFTAAIYVAPTILAANPDFKVSLALKMTDPNNEANVLTIGTPATYTVKDLLPLPTATVTTVKNDDLTFALNFKADEATEAQLDAYGKWYADFVLTVNKEVTFNADGGANGYLAGQYDAWSENWVYVPFEDVTLKANESLKIMAYAAELLGQSGLKLTYNDVYSFVKDFDCGVFFEPAFLAANPDLNVTLELRMYNPANEAESYVIGETYTFPVPLPTATVTTVKNDDLTFALNFKADEATEAQLDAYGKWYADFVLTVNKEVTFNADGGANGYLAGQYDAWSENWVYVPFEDVTLKANESLKIMAYAAELLGQSGLKLTYNDVYSFVKDFDCGVFFEPAFLAANPDLNVTLELRMYNPANEAESYVIGETYTFNIPTVEVKNEVVTDTMSDKQKEAVAEIVTNTVVTQADTGLLDATAEITAAKEALKNQDGVTAEAVANAMPVIAITVKKVEFIDEEPSKLTFDVTPTLSVGETSVEMNTFAKALTFRLPVPTEWDGLVKVSHAGTLMGTYTIQESEGTKFVELSSASFSEFAIEPIDTALVAKIGETPYATLADAVAAVADNTATTITLIDNVALNETLTIPEGKTVTIDLNGKSISMEESIVTTAYALNNLGTLTLKDSVGTGSVNARGIYNGYGNGGDNVATAKIIVESGTYNAKGTNGGAAIFNYGIVEINGGSFTSIGGYSLNNQAGSSMTIADGVTANNGIYCSNAKVTVNGGNISGNRSGCHVVYAWNSKLTINGGMFYNNNSGNATIMSAGTTECTITGGTFGIKDGRVEGNGNTWTSCLTDTANTATMTVTGGTFNGGFRVQAGTTMTIEGGTFNDVGGSGYGISGTASVKGGTFTDATAKTFASNNMAEGYELIDGTVVKAAPTTVEVGTLAELLAALADNSNGLPIVVTAEIKIPAGATVVLDLNGKTVTSVYQTDSTTKHIYPLNVYGNLTIKDTKDNGSITGRGIFVQVGSKLTIDGGSIYAIDSNGGSALYMYGGDVVINGGHIEQKAEGTYNFAINGLGGTITVNGGWVGGNHGAIATEAATVVINGGELVCTGTAGMTDNVLYTYGTGSITINGGTFVADKDGPAGGCCVYDANGGATINGGTFGNSSGGDVWGTTGTTIKGGKFENLTEKQHIAPGYELKADGSVGSAKVYVAEIDGQGYETLDEAIEAAVDGDTIVLLSSVEYSGGDIYANITLDLNGKTITATGTYVFWFEGGSLTVKDSSAEKTGMIDGSETVGNVFLLMGEESLTIESGKIHANNNVIYAYGNGVTVVINGGELKSYIDSGNIFYLVGADDKITVNGGTFIGNVHPFAAGLSIKGGLFTADVNAYCAANRGAVKNGDGMYEIIEVSASNAAAQIGDKYYLTLGAAINAAGDNDTIYVLKDVTESLPTLRGKILPANGNVTITATNSDWLYCAYTFVIGEGVTLNVPALFYYAGGAQINGTLIVDAYYQSNAGTKLTINEPGSMTVTGETFILRSTAGDANAGVYVNGGTLNASVIYFYQGMISATNGGTINTGVYWQTNETDGQGTANLVLDNATLNVTVYDHPAKATGNSTVTLKNGSTMNCQNGDFVAGDNAKVAVDSSSSIIGKNGPIEFGLAGSGTETAPYVIASVDDLVLFRDSVNKGETKYNAPGVYVALTADIDMAGVNWVGIGSINQDHGFMGNFDGNGKTIKNLTITNPTLVGGYAYAGFFSITEGSESAQNTIKNLTIENVTISTTGHIVSAAIAYPYYTIVENVKVCGNISITGGDYTAGALAYTRRCVNAKDISVVGNAGSTITGAQVVGGVISDIQMNGGLTAVYSNFSAENLTIKGTSMVGGISGIIATQTLNGAIVKNVTIDCSDRAGQVAGSFGGTCTISNIVVENVTGADVIIGAAYDGAAPVQAKIGDTFYATFADAYAVAQAGQTITLLADMTSSDIIVLDKAITLDGNGKKLTSTAGRAINVSGADGVTIKNLTINASGERAINIIQNATNVTIDNVTATAANYTVNVASSAPEAVVAIKDSTLNGLCTVNVSAAGAQVTVDNSTINCNDNNSTAGESYAALSLNKEAIGGSIVATNTTVNVTEGSDSMKGRNGAENGTVTINGSIEGVAVMVAVITYEGSDYYHAFASLKSAIEFAKDGETIKLIRDVTASEIITINKAITLDGNGKTLTSTAGRAINVSGANGVTIKNLTISASGERAINIIQNATNVTIDNVTATAANYTVNVASSAPNAVVAITNSTLNGLCTVNVSATGAKVAIDNSTVNCNDNNTTAGEAYAALSLNKEAVGGSIVATNTTVNVTEGSDSIVGRNGAENGAVTINGSTEGVAVMVAVITYEGSPYYHSFQTLAKAIEFAKAGDTITLLRDVTASEVILIGKSITINGNDHKVTSSATRVFRVTTSNTEVTLNDVDMVSTANVVYPNDVRGISIDPSLTNVKLTLNNCSVDFTDASACDWAYAVNISGNGTGHTLAVNGGTYEGANVINAHGASNTIVVKNATLNCLYPNNDMYSGACIWVLQNQGSSVEATGNTFNGSNAIAFNLGTGTTLAESNNTDNTVRYITGKGTESDPYLIKDVKQLVLFRDSVNAGETTYNAPGKWVALGADIDMTGVDWSVNIGDAADTSFDGIFDGKGKTIRNLKSVESAKDPWGYICTGLFGCIAGDAQIKNLTLENVDITAGYVGNNVAALVGFAWSCTGTIDNVTVKNVKINATNATGVGAIVGYDYYSPALKVTNCTVDGTSINGAAYVGGVIGYASNKITLNNNTVKNLTINGTASVGGVAGIMLAGGSASGNTIDTVTLSATGAMWANSVGAVAGTMTNGSITVAGTTVTGGNVTDIVGGILVEKPTTPIEKVQVKIGDTYYTTAETARKDAETLAETLVATGDKKGVDAFNTMYLLGGSFKKTSEGTLHYDYAFGVSNVTYVGGTTDKPFKVTVAIKDADSTADRTLTGRTLVLRMVVENEDGTIAKEVVEPIEDPEFTAVGGQVTCDVFVALPEAGEGKATYFTVKVTDEE